MTKWCKADMIRPLATLLCILSAALPAWAQAPGAKNAKGEFPGLNLLPAGSVVKGISLPRYENHRVSSHIMANELKVISAQLVKLSGIRSLMYKEDGSTTVVEMQLADYNFETEMIISKVKATVRNPQFSSEGAAVSFSTQRQQGLLKGPVNTVINTQSLSQSAK